MKEGGKIKVAFIQRICPHYRVPMFSKLSELDGIDLTVYFSKISSDSRIQDLKNASNIKGFKYKQLNAIYFQLKLSGRTFPIVFNPSLFFELLNDRPDVIITGGVANIINNISILLYYFLTKTPFIWMSLGSVRTRSISLFRKVLNPLIKFMLKRASAILGYSSYAKEFFNSYYNIRNDKIYVMYNSTVTDEIFRDIEKHKSRINVEKEKLNLANKKIILFVGTFKEGKRVANLIKAYTHLKVQYKDTALLLVGDGPRYEKLRNLVQKEQIPDIVFTGKKIKDVNLYFQLGDIFVMPGLGGLSINQAMANGLPIISAPADGTEIDMVINGRNGFRVKQDDVEDLEKAIEKILKDENAMIKMGQESKKLAETRFNIRNTVDIIKKAILYAYTKSKENNNERYKS